MKSDSAALAKTERRVEEELEEDEELVTIQLPRSKAEELLEILEKVRKLIDDCSWTTG
jgi:hypothetical protein